MSYFPSSYTLNAATPVPVATDNAGLVLVMPLMPVPILVICEMSPLATPMRHRFGMPSRSEMKRSAQPSGPHCGLMFLPDRNARDGGTTHVVASTTARRQSPLSSGG